MIYKHALSDMKVNWYVGVGQEVQILTYVVEARQFHTNRICKLSTDRKPHKISFEAIIIIRINA